MSQKTRPLARILVISSLLVPIGASAADNGFALNRFEPSERGSDWFALDSLDLRGHTRWATGLVGDYAYRPLVIYNADGSVQSAIVRNQFFVHAGASINLFERLRLGLNLPIALYQSGSGGILAGNNYTPPSTALGDLRLGVDVRLLGTYGTPFTLALGAQVFLPTGSQKNYASDGAVRLLPRATAAGDIGMFAYAASLSMQYRSQEVPLNGASTGSELGFGLAAGVRLLDRKLLLGPELYCGTVVTSGQFFSRRTTPVEALLGGHYQVSEFRFGLGAGPGLSRGFGTPALRVLASVEWAPTFKKAEEPPPPSDRDHDDVLDNEDACPDEPGLPSTDRAINGCPAAPPPAPPADRDQDGVLDADDACPDVAGVKTEGKKTNGCPPPPPPPPPPPDRDGDKILDADDACPDAAGPKNEDPKKHGCPGARVEAGEIKIIEQVKFKTDSALILPESETILDAIRQILVDHPEITKLSIEGHTDGKGGRAHNLKLSKARSAAVMTWLTKHGIAADRLTSTGFGPDKPIDTNDTEDGRRNNRRVELHIDGTSAAPSAKIQQAPGTGAQPKSSK